MNGPSNTMIQLRVVGDQPDSKTVTFRHEESRRTPLRRIGLRFNDPCLDKIRHNFFRHCLKRKRNLSRSRDTIRNIRICQMNFHFRHIHW